MSRTPAAYPLVAVRGATFEDEFTYTDADGVAIDMTGYEARMQVRAIEYAYGTGNDAEGLVATYTTTGVSPRLAWDTAVGGRLVLTVPAADTVALNPDNERTVKLYYGIEVYVPEGGSPEYVIPLVQGSLTVRGEVVR